MVQTLRRTVGVERLVPGLIQRASEMLGGMAGLASFLHVAEHSLYLWALGKARAPARVVEALVDLVLRDDVARAKEDRRHEPRASEARRFVTERCRRTAT